MESAEVWCSFTMMVGADSTTAAVERIPGSSVRSFEIAFLFIFCIGTALVFGGLIWATGKALGLSYTAAILVGCVGLSAVLARLASFEVATLVTVSPEGIETAWTGPFGGRQVQHMSWNEIQSVRVVRFSGTCSIGSRIALNYIEVTFEQARAILGHPSFPLKDLPPRVRTRIGLSS